MNGGACTLNSVVLGNILVKEGVANNDISVYSNYITIYKSEKNLNIVKETGIAWSTICDIANNKDMIVIRTFGLDHEYSKMA